MNDPQERRPAQVAAGSPRRPFRQVLAHGSRRDPNPQLEQQFVGDPLFAPQHVLPGHPADQLAQFFRDRRPTSPGLHSPEESPACSMPTNHRRRLHDNKCAAPIEQPCQDGQADSSCRIYRSRLDAALDVQRQLTAQEEVLGLDRFGRTEQQHHPAQGVFDQAQCNPGEGDHALIVPQRSALSLPRDAACVGRHFCGGQLLFIVPMRLPLKGNTQTGCSSRCPCTIDHAASFNITGADRLADVSGGKQPSATARAPFRHFADRALLRCCHRRESRSHRLGRQADCSLRSALLRDSCARVP